MNEMTDDWQCIILAVMICLVIFIIDYLATAPGCDRYLYGTCFEFSKRYEFDENLTKTDCYYCY